MPDAVKIRGQRHTATVLQVIEADADGSPRTFRVLRDDESMKLEGGEVFWIVYAPERMTRRRD